MTRLRFALLFAALPAAAPAQNKEKDKKGEPAPVYPVALLGFEERGAGAKDLGPKLVDRTDLKKVLDEQALTLAGAVKADEAVKVGQLTGAKLLVTGSVVQVDKKLYLIAKIIGSETGKVVGVSVEGVQTDELGTLAGKLADQIVEKLGKEAEKLSPKPATVVDRITELNKKLGKSTRPVLHVSISERHVGVATIDPAAQTEVGRFSKETGFELVDVEEGNKGKADILITGEGISETAGRLGSLVSVRARVEIKAVDRKTGKVLAVDRQTALVVDLSEQVAGKQALQDAAGLLAERMLPKLVKARRSDRS
jgi:hypothetical protein